MNKTILGVPIRGNLPFTGTQGKYKAKGAHRIGMKSVFFENNYSLKIVNNEDGSQALALERNNSEGEATSITLDMASIYTQCSQSAVISKVVEDMKLNICMAEKLLPDVNKYRDTVHYEIQKAEKLIHEIGNEEICSFPVSGEYLPF